MPNKTPKTPLALIFSMENARNSHGYVHPHVYLVKRDEQGKIVNLRSGEAVNGFPYLDDLRLEAQGSTDNREQGFYGYDRPWYINVFKVDVWDAAKMSATLTKVTKGLQKIYDTRGMAKSFGEMAGRLGEVIGATEILIKRDTSWGTLYSEMEFSSYSLGDGVNQINHVIRMWQEGK